MVVVAVAGAHTREILSRLPLEIAVAIEDRCRGWGPLSHLLTSPPYSSIREHASACDSPVSLDNFSILGSCKNVLDLRILESLYIFKLKPSLNNMQSANPLFLVDK